LIHQRVSFLFPLVLMLACGGGAGPPAGLEDGASTPDETPPYSDDVVVPPATPNDGELPPPPPTGVGAPISRGNTGGGGGGECAVLCSEATDRGCSTPESECLEGCNELSGECAAEIRSLLRCALRQFCIEDIDPEDPQSLLQIATACPNQAVAVSECQAENPDDV
jgi:hypothetical protein